MLVFRGVSRNISWFLGCGGFFHFFFGFVALWRFMIGSSTMCRMNCGAGTCKNLAMPNRFLTRRQSCRCGCYTTLAMAMVLTKGFQVFKYIIHMSIFRMNINQPKKTKNCLTGQESMTCSFFWWHFCLTPPKKNPSGFPPVALCWCQTVPFFHPWNVHRSTFIRAEGEGTFGESVEGTMLGLCGCSALFW